MSADEEIALLRALPLFEGTEPEALRILTFSTTRRTLKSGEILFSKGEYSEGAYLIIDGEIALDPMEDGTPTPHRYRRGSLIGQLGLFIRLERPATAIANGITILVVISRDLMLKVLEAHPHSAARIRANLAKNTAKLVHQLAAVPL